MTARPRVVLAAGGTGGHVFPADALAAALRAREIEPVLFTDRRGRAFGAGIEVRRIRGGGIAGQSALGRARSLAGLALGFLQARRELRAVGPAAVVGFGGYASVPTVLAAAFAGLPAIVHEQNAVLGRANRLLAGRVRRVATAFASVARVPNAAAARVVRVGMPVRPAFESLRGRAYRAPEPGEPLRLLVLGGSQGAKVLGDVLPAAVARLDPGLRGRLTIVQQCRPEGLADVDAAYRRIGVPAELAPFFDDVPVRLASAHLLIARSGASTVAELTTIGCPALLVPYPFATEDHQTANARALDAAGAATCIPQPEFTADALAQRLTALLADPAALARMAEAARAAGSEAAAERLADLVIATMGLAAALPARSPGRLAA